MIYALRFSPPNQKPFWILLSPAGHLKKESEKDFKDRIRYMKMPYATRTVLEMKEDDIYINFCSGPMGFIPDWNKKKFMYLWHCATEF